MKYSEFRQEVELMGFENRQDSVTVGVESTSGTLLTVSKKRIYEFDNEWSYFVKLDAASKEKLFDLAYQLAKTPLAEREEEKLYRVKFPNVTRSGNSIYLEKKQSSKDKVGVDWRHEDFIFEEPHSYIFTEQEIKDIDERYLAFKVEVTE